MYVCMKANSSNFRGFSALFMTETKLRSIDTKNNENVATTDSEFVPVLFFCHVLRCVKLV